MASLSGVFNNQEFTDTGVPLAGGRVYTYAQGTTTQKDVYTDIAGTIPHTYTSDGAGGLYIGLNARGELPAPMYFGAGPYDICLKRADGSTVWTRRADGVGQIAADLAASSGASLVGYDDGTVQDVLDDAKPMQHYAALRAYTGRATGIRLTSPAIAGFFYRDGADATSADNGGTVIVDAGGRRWKRLVFDRVLVSWFEPVANGIADDSTKIAAAAAAVAAGSSSIKLIFGKSKTYLLQSFVQLDAPIDIDLNGSTLNFTFDAALKSMPGFNVQTDYVSIEGGTITVVGTTMGGAGLGLCCVGAGNETTGAGYKHLNFRNLTVSTNRNEAGAMLGFLGECSDVVIENITVPDNPYCRNVIGIEWAGVPANGTGHPHDFKIRNINCGRLTYPLAGETGFGYVVWSSSAFNISVENITVVEGFGLMAVMSGDNGAQYAPLKYKALVGTGISLKNASIAECFGYGIRVVGKGDMTAELVDNSLVAENITVNGKQLGTENNAGLVVEYCNQVKINGFTFNGVSTGISMGVSTRRLTLSNGQVKNCRLFGASINNGAVQCAIEHVEFLNNNASGGAGVSTAAIVVGESYGTRITDCTFGENGGAETQKYSIYVDPAARRPALDNNHTYALAAGGTSYVIGALLDTAIEARGINNTSAEGLTNASGAPIFQVHPNGDRSFTATLTPSTGTYRQGDRCYFPDPVAAGFIAAVCVSPGAPGTWKNFGAISA